MWSVHNKICINEWLYEHHAFIIGTFLFSFTVVCLTVNTCWVFEPYLHHSLFPLSAPLNIVTPSFHASVKWSVQLFLAMLRTSVNKEQAKAKMKGNFERTEKSIICHTLDILEISLTHVSQKKFCSRKHLIWVSTWQMEKCLCLQCFDSKHFWFRTLVLNFLVYTKWPFVWENWGTIIFAEGFHLLLKCKSVYRCIAAECSPEV